MKEGMVGPEQASKVQVDHVRKLIEGNINYLDWSAWYADYDVSCIRTGEDSQAGPLGEHREYRYQGICKGRHTGAAFST
jgi:hypothetical protein